MSIVRWAPFSAYTSIERQMQSMLEQFPGRGWLEGFDWKPDTDVTRENGTLRVRAELPGIDPADVTVELEGSVLHISGEKKSERTIEEEERYLRECRYGAFHRDIMLPEGVDGDKIEARHENGVLTVTVPLPEEVAAEEAQPVAIEVTTV